MATPEIATRLLVLDNEPWYHAPAGYADEVRKRLRPWYPEIVDAAQLGRLTAALADAVLQPGDVVVAPLMSGALLLPTLDERCRRLGIPLLLLPMSKHPFVTLSADDHGDLMRTCRCYADASGKLRLLPVLLQRLVHGGSRIVFFDSNSATGRDALLFRELCAQWLGRPPCFCFAVLVNEIGDTAATAPGWRSGPKALRPDACALQLRGTNTKYLSHVRFLCRAWEAQVLVARQVRAAFPDLTAYWDTVPSGLCHIHPNRDPAVPIYRERLHVRFGPDDDDDLRGAVSSAVAELDVRFPLRLDPPRHSIRAQLIGRWAGGVTAREGDGMTLATARARPGSARSPRRKVP
jgi:hypothetical protein